MLKKKEIPLGEVYGLLEPGPVVLLTTARGGRPNVMTMSWHLMMDFEPPLVGFVLSDRDYSYESLRASRQCVLNVPTADLGKAVVGCGNCSGRDTDKFKRFGLTPVQGAAVAAPLIAECFASLEARLVDDSLAAKYGLFVVEVVKAWADGRRRNPRTLHHRGWGTFMVAGRQIRLASKMR